MNIRDEHEDDDDLRAAEYVLGTLDAQARARVAERSEREPALARLIDAWRGRLSPMADDIAPVSPPMHLWHLVRRRAGLDAIERMTVPLWERLAFWRGVGFAGLATTAACVVAFLAMPRIAPAPADANYALPHPVRLVSTLADGKGRTTFVAAIDEDACTIVLMPHDRQPAPGQVPELWVIASDGRPHSIGTGTDAPQQAMVVPAALRTTLLGGDANTRLAVSMEPPGGSPTGQPSGFIAGRGSLTQL